MCICSLLCTGSQLIELDVFMQYYRQLLTEMSLIDADKCYSYFKAGIITDNDMKMIQFHPGVYMQEIILIRMANHLLSGNINLFHKMLEILRNSYFAYVIHTTLRSKYSIGVYINVLYMYRY